MLLRYSITFGLAAFVTFGIFFVMQSLISTEGRQMKDLDRSQALDFVRLKRESATRARRRELPDKAEKKLQPPPLPDLDLSKTQRPDPSGASIALPDMSADFSMAGGLNLGMAPADTEATPILRVPPIYPPRALERGIEGWVLVEFTISPTGAVKDPVIVDSEPSSIFHRAALRSIRKWKYRPKVVDGVSVERPGIRTRLTFEMQE
jgi:protein TonB